MSFSELLKRFRLMNSTQIKISFEKPLLYVNAERKVVKCTLKGVLHLPKEVAKSLGYPEDLKVAARSTAVCKENDTFSEEKGIKIAIAQAESNAYRNAAERLVRTWKRGNDIVVDFLDEDNPTLNSKVNAFVRKANGCVTHNKRYITEIGA